MTEQNSALRNDKIKKGIYYPYACPLIPISRLRGGDVFAACRSPCKIKYVLPSSTFSALKARISAFSIGRSAVGNQFRQIFTQQRLLWLFPHPAALRGARRRPFRLCARLSHPLCGRLRLSSLRLSFIGQIARQTLQGGGRAGLLFSGQRYKKQTRGGL